MLGGFAVLDPKGLVALSERSLMIHAVEFMLIVAIPVYFLLFYFAYKYRATNTTATYMPDWEHGWLEEFVWWVIPFEIILVLGALAWSSTHQLDPRRALGASAPLVVDVVALDWKWLFIYPAQGIATVNYLEIPVDREVEFRVTADAPMNSFWIPSLGTQIYAMSGMINTLHLVANQPGVFDGGSANYSGSGFADMKFKTNAVSSDEFDSWVRQSKFATATLAFSSYKDLARPSTSTPLLFGSVDDTLYDSIVSQFMSSTTPAHH